LRGVAADREQIRHRLGSAKIGAPEMLRCAKDLGLKARACRTGWSRLVKTPLPAIAALRDGGFMVIAKASEDRVLVQSPQAPRPVFMTRAELFAIWDGELILMARRAGLSDITRRFDITWFIGAIHKYRHLLSEVLIASFFLQLFALVSPLFFQVVIDKVLVHRGLSTLDVLIMGLIAISLFETVLGILRTYLFAHTTNRIDVELGARLFHHLVALPLAYFHELGPDPRHRSVFHVCFPGGDVPVLPAADVVRTRLVSVLHSDLDGGDAPVPSQTGRKIPAGRREPGLPSRECDRY
jgi:subfamily B ATP-binding cassette protein HlyB/CyaB